MGIKRLSKSMVSTKFLNFFYFLHLYSIIAARVKLVSRLLKMGSKSECRRLRGQFLMRLSTYEAYKVDMVTPSINTIPSVRVDEGIKRLKRK